MNRLLLKLAALAVIIGVLIYPRISESQSHVMYENQVAVLAYHHIDDELNNGVTISSELFRDQLDYLKARGYQFISLGQFQSYLSGGAVPPNAVLVTFDDGYQSFYTHAYPILKELGIPSAHFLITSATDHPFEAKLPSLSREEVKELAARGSVQFECHSERLHQKDKNGTPLLLSRLSNEEQGKPEQAFREAIEADTKSCLSKLNELQPAMEHKAYAYPYGMFDDGAIELLKKGGIEYAFTTLSEVATPSDDPMQIPRINAGSPYVNPSALHNLIMFKTVTELQDDLPIPLGQSVLQIGGNIVQQSDQSLNVDWDKKQWKMRPGSNIVQTAEGEVRLKAPIERRDKRNYIRSGDLQKLVKHKIIYNKSRNYYHLRKTPGKNKNQWIEG